MRLRVPGPARRVWLGAAVGVLVAGLGALVAVQWNGAAAPSPDARATTGPPASSSHQGPPSVTFLGDSWTAASGSESGEGYAVLAAEQLGWRYDVLGVGGTGYLRGAPDRAYAQWVDEAAGTGADVVVVQGSLNDLQADVRALRPAARETLAALQEAVDPGTEIVVIGAPEAPGTDPAGIEAINDAIGRAASALGLRFVDPAEEGWNDPADPTIWADATHPNDAGYRLIADHVVELLEEAVED